MPETAEIEQIERPPKRVWDRILAEPDRAPEYIALAAAIPVLDRLIEGAPRP